MAKCCLLFQSVTAPTVANLQQKAIRMSGLYPTFSRARAVGQLTYNMDLSRRRSQSVVQALVQANGIAAVRLTGHGVGPLAPVAPNTDDAGRARNRRTELVPQ